MTRAILIDTDPGQDDALAILLALACPDQLDLRAITTVAGNVPVAQTTANAIRVCDLADRADIPVHAGADRPLIFALETAEFVCGPDGLDGAGLPPPSRVPTPGHGVQALIDTARACPVQGLTICALGPLTNLALALRIAPDIADHIAAVVVMGGARDLGNMTPAAEFNFHVDPHAAEIVLTSGLPVTLFGLHVTLTAQPSAADLAALAALPSRTARSVLGMMTRPRPGGLGTAGHPMHDPCTVAYLVWPDLFTLRPCHVTVETADGPLRGRSTIDWNNRLKLPPNVDVVASLDRDALFARMIDALARLP